MSTKQILERVKLLDESIFSEKDALIKLSIELSHSVNWSEKMLIEQLKEIKTTTNEILSLIDRKRRIKRLNYIK